MRALAPMNGPIYGGFAIDIDGKGFIDTGAITVRFELLQDDLLDTNARVAPPNSTASLVLGTSSQQDTDPSQSTAAAPEPIIVDARADFVSTERLLCIAPTFAHEGVYMVSVALNGAEFSRISATSWFLVWQNWQRRKLLLAAHGMFAHSMVRRDGSSAVPGASALSTLNQQAQGAGVGSPSSLVPNDLHVLRRKGSFMLAPQAEDADSSDPRAFGGVRLPLLHKAPERVNSVMDTVMQYYEQVAAEAGELTDPKLLHWHPASAADEKCVCGDAQSCLRLDVRLGDALTSLRALLVLVLLVAQRPIAHLAPRQPVQHARDAADPLSPHRDRLSTAWEAAVAARARARRRPSGQRRRRRR